jgi:periplasmic protein CpxP/Spy
MKANKTMLIAALAAGSLLVWSPALRAADTNTPSSTPPAGAPPAGQRPSGMRGGSNLDQLAQQLNLTNDQKAKVKPILEARDQKMRDLRGDTTMSQEDRRIKMQAIRQDVTTQLKAVLTPEQFDKWQKSSPMGRGPRNSPPPGNEKAGSTNAPAAPPQQ